MDTPTQAQTLLLAYIQ
jgi:hypothetical protein